MHLKNWGFVFKVIGAEFDSNLIRVILLFKCKPTQWGISIKDILTDVWFAIIFQNY